MKLPVALGAVGLYLIAMAAFVGFIFRVPVTWWGNLLVMAVSLALAALHVAMFNALSKSSVRSE
jgi:hypothetical protein